MYVRRSSRNFFQGVGGPRDNFVFQGGGLFFREFYNVNIINLNFPGEPPPPPPRSLDPRMSCRHYVEVIFNKVKHYSSLEPQAPS